MESKNTFLWQETEGFMRGELDNVTVANARILLDMVQGSYVPYGCYTTQPVTLPAFDALRVSWNAGTPQGTAVEAQARVLVDGNWTTWSSFGRWSPYLKREGARPVTRGPLVLKSDRLVLDSKVATQAQVRIYLYTKDEKITPSVGLLGVSVRAVDVIPARGRPLNARLHLMPYAMGRRAPALGKVMDLAISLTSLCNRWGADILPEEFAIAMRDFLPGQDERNLSFAAAVAGCWGFPTWVCWADLALLRAEVRAGYGVVVQLQSTPAQTAAGLPVIRYAALRGFANQDGEPAALLIDPWAGDGSDFDTETSLPLDDFLVAWNNVALCMRPRKAGVPDGCPARTAVWLRPALARPEGGRAPEAEQAPEDAALKDIYRMTVNGVPRLLPDDFCGRVAPASPAGVASAPGGGAPDAAGAVPPPDGDAAPAARPGPAVTGLLAWSLPDEKPHATTAHRTLHFTTPQQGGIRLVPAEDGVPRKYTVYAIDPAGCMLVGDVMV